MGLTKPPAARAVAEADASYEIVKPPTDARKRRRSGVEADASYGD